MTNRSEAKARILEILDYAASDLEGSLFETPENNSRILDVLAVQGNDAPVSLLEYWRLAGSASPQSRTTASDPDGIWREFARHGGFSTRTSLRSRLIAIDTAISAGHDWSLFRLAEPTMTFNYLPGGSAVYWVNFDGDDGRASHDPPVWTLSEKPGDSPRLVSDRFSDYVLAAVNAEIERRNHNP